MPFVIFDLDGTVINSDHRKATKADGSLDLAHWFENNTPEKIALDTLLPLARIMRELHKAGNTIIVCTARSIDTPEIQRAHDQFFIDNDLPYHVFLGRESGNMESHASLKVRLLNDYFKREGFENTREAGAIMFDDNFSVINALTKIGVKCYDAVTINKRIAA